MKTGGVTRHIDGQTDFGSGMGAARRDDLTVADIRKAMDWRARHGGGWLAAARVVGCSEHALRLACDPDYRPVHAPARPVTTTFTPRKAVATGEPGAGRVDSVRSPRVITIHDIAGQLVLALAEPAGSLGHTASALGERISRDRNQTNGLLKNLCGRDLADGSGGEQGNVMRWRLTTRGRALAERLKDSIRDEGDTA